MSESTVPSIRPDRTHIVTLPGTSSSGTIADVGTLDFSTGPRSKSTTSIWTGSSQRELTINRLSGKLGAHQSGGSPARGASAPTASSSPADDTSTTSSANTSITTTPTGRPGPSARDPPTAGPTPRSPTTTSAFSDATGSAASSTSIRRSPDR